MIDACSKAKFDKTDCSIVNGKKIKRFSVDGVYKYYQYEPLQWQVISSEGNSIFLITDKIIDCELYHNTEESVDWNDSDINSWLNSTFINDSFTNEEKENIIKSDYGYVWLLSYDELNSLLYKKNSFESKDVITYSTDYARSKGFKDNGKTGDGWWYLRNDNKNDYTMRTGSLSGISVMGAIGNGFNEGTGIRPGIILKIR